MNEKEHSHKLRILVLWSRPSGYLHACLEALAQRPEVSHVLTVMQPPHSDEAPYDLERLQGHYERFFMSLSDNAEPLKKAVQGLAPHLVLAGGSWRHGPYRQVLRQLRGKAVRVLCMDTQWHGTLRQRFLQVIMRGQRRAFYDRAFVAGTRQASYARHLGFKEHEIQTGLYACDFQRFSKALQNTSAGRFAKPAFLYIGRLVRHKGVQELIRGYALYRQECANPWPLRICGEGPLKEALQTAPGVEYLGFIQPEELPDIMVRHAALLVPSHYEPWGVVIHEGAAAGMALVCSKACGATDFFLQDSVNGVLLPQVTAASVARAMQVMSSHSEECLAAMGAASRQLAAGLTPVEWAEKVIRFVDHDAK